MTSKILVVDDSITIQKIVAMAFEKEDAAVEGIGNGSEALVKLKKFKPDIVLADVNMPGLNGFELSKKIKESSEFDSVSVLLLTSDFEDFDEDLFHDSLADDHITKPFKSEDIVRRVMDLLNGTDGSDTVDDDEDVITLSPTDRTEDESVVDQGKSQLVDPPEEISLDEDEMQLELSDEDMLVTLENPEDEELVVGFEEDSADHTPPEPEEDLAVTAESPCADSPESVEAPPAKQVPEESLDELVRRVTELSQKSEAIRDQRSAEEVQPMEALDEMIREVNALKKGSTALGEEGNGVGENSSPPDTPEVNTVIAELDYFSEENAEELEAAFNEILRGNKHFAPPATPDPADEIASADEGNEDDANEIVSEPETFHEDLIISPVKISPANSVETPEIETLPETSEVEASLEKNNVGEEESFADISAFQSSQEVLYARLMGEEFREVLEQSLTASMGKEISKISEEIIKSVEEAVKAIVPGLVQEMIAKEIEQHKNENNR
jgi:DNA-binding response OmpR family regulator